MTTRYYFFRTRRTNIDGVTYKKYNIKKVSKNVEYHIRQVKKVIDGYELILYKLDCDSRKLGLIQIAVYDKTGKNVNNTKLEDYEVEIDYVIPESIGETYLDTYCNHALIE